MQAIFDSISLWKALGGIAVLLLLAIFLFWLFFIREPQNIEDEGDYSNYSPPPHGIDETSPSVREEERKWGRP